MKQQSKATELENAIAMLQDQRNQQLIALKEQFQDSYESLKPINLFKSTVRELTHDKDFTGNLASNLIGITTGFFTRKLLVGNKRSPLKDNIGALLQYIVSNQVTKHGSTIAAVALHLRDKLLPWRSSSSS